MLKLRIKKGDKVVIVTGKDKGKTGEVIKVVPKDHKVVVAGVNVVKRHTKASMNSEGGIVHKERPVHISNVAIVDPKSGSATKVGFKFLDSGQKVRFAKKSGEQIGS